MISNKVFTNYFKTGKRRKIRRKRGAGGPFLSIYEGIEEVNSERFFFSLVGFIWLIFKL